MIALTLSNDALRALTPLQRKLVERLPATETELRQVLYLDAVRCHAVIKVQLAYARKRLRPYNVFIRKVVGSDQPYYLELLK